MVLNKEKKYNVRNIKNWLLSIKERFRVFQVIRKRHRSIFSNREFSRVKLTHQEKREYLKYWRGFGKNINLETVEICKSLSGRFDKRIVPEEIFELYIQSKLQKINNISFLANKNIYNKWFNKGIFPKDYIHRINGAFYDSNLNLVDNFKYFLEKTEIEFPVVFKPSIDSSGGSNIFFLNSKKEIFEKRYDFENFIIQENIKQYSRISKIYPNCLNTVRVCLLRKPSNSEIVVLNTSLRMGKDGSLDNESAGGIVCNINEKGLLNHYAVDKYAKKYIKHPNSNIIFEDWSIPSYEELIQTSIKVAKQVIYAGLISLDMCLDDQKNWRCIEINLRFQTIRFSQYAGVPFFGNSTDEVIDYCKI